MSRSETICDVILAYYKAEVDGSNPDFPVDSPKDAYCINEK